MRFFAMTAACLMASINAYATETWSACQTVIGVNNTIGLSNVLTHALSPGIAGCGNVVPGGINFIIGTDGVSSTTINGVLAQALAAYAAVTKVMIFYDTGVTGCAGVVLANGGYAGQC